jgi:hypothetical protein
MAPSLPAPISIATPAVSPSFGPGLTQGLTQAQEALSGFGKPNDFLGSMFEQGPASTVGALNAATGQDWSGTARVAMGGDQFAQPAMLGMGNAYAAATGQPGYKGLFDGLFGSSAPTPDPTGRGGLYGSSAPSSGFGFTNPLNSMPSFGFSNPLNSMPEFGFTNPFAGSSPGWGAGTGGLYDPRGAGGLYGGPSQGGFFSGVSDFFGGMFGGGGDSGLGNTPGAGGLY